MLTKAVETKKKAARQQPLKGLNTKSALQPGWPLDARLTRSRQPDQGL